jgi:hypothetical protein
MGQERKKGYAQIQETQREKGPRIPMVPIPQVGEDS